MLGVPPCPRERDGEVRGGTAEPALRVTWAVGPPLPTLRRKRLHCALIKSEVDVFLRRGRRAAGLALDLGAQRQHVRKTLLAELRVRREAEAGIDELRIGE